ncbi:DUF3455 domain-containing protein [Comamonas thiooxydans]|uniref:DUF3455 domain-containing protein n=2 Tax=Comamonas thiooxydans TaxID=363952 RepID=A0A0E3BP30_9BURK|nr:DUF3455 domain-containing protein [Comamonas thiooxydans]KGH06510.1 hypothetical protein P608_22930 [Comamonas thiooxydans]KGH12413.1 hypothetical protein P607_25120 [Comamonas thiooxydans]KGH21771.1 hypothetical protein P606_17955 [Comamonas thiooxydans]
MTHRHTLSLTALCLSALGLSACASMGSHSMYSQAELPASVQVPAGHKVVMETVGIGQITYECRAKKDMATEHEWVFVGPDAKLQTRSGMVIGKYWGPPATWENNDGSKVTAAQLAVAPAGAGNIPLQLVKANPATGMGAMQGVTYIQRVATKGGVAPSMACGTANLGSKQIVQYQADYIFWKAA